MTEKRPATYLILFNLGIFFLLLSVLPFFLQSLLFLICIPVNPFVLPVCFVLAFANLLYQLTRLEVSGTHKIIWCKMVLLLITGSHFASVSIYDFSYDGLWYHQDAVILLKEGWNPDTHVLAIQETSLSDLYLNHYPKATWIVQACYYSLLPYLEGAKSVNFYMVFAAFFLSIALIRQVLHLRWIVAGIFALFIALNPVAICQLFTFYVDGLVGGVITCVVCLAILLVVENDHSRQTHLYLALALLFLVNIKFTSLVYACILAAGFIAYLFFYQKEKWFKNALFYAGVFAFGVLVLGYSTYVRNTIQNGHPFYPLMGENNIGEQVAKVTMPANFIDKNRFEKFNLATFARPEWARAPLSSRAKPLFTKEGFTEYDAFRRADAEMSGFGPAYAEMFLLIAAGILLLILFDRKRITIHHLVLFMVILVSIIIMPAFWYARYAPQIWLLSMILTMILFAGKRTRWLAIIIMLFTFADIEMVMKQNFSQFAWQTKTLNETFDRLKSEETLPLVHEGWVRSFKVKMKEQKVRYIPVSTEHIIHDSIVLFPGIEMANAFYVVTEKK